MARRWARAIRSDPELSDTLLVMLTSLGLRGDAKRLASMGSPPA